METKWIIMAATLAFGLLAGQEARAFYDASSGRWLSRDPLGELGGRNLYGFCHNNPEVSIDRDGRYVIETAGQLAQFYEQEKTLYDTLSKMVENFENCKPWCGGVASPVSYYCQCIEQNWRKVDEIASCICVQVPDDKECKDKVKAKFGGAIQFADSILKSAELAEKARDLTDKIEDVKKKLEKLKNPKECCPKK